MHRPSLCHRAKFHICQELYICVLAHRWTDYSNNRDQLVPNIRTGLFINRMLATLNKKNEKTQTLLIVCFEAKQETRSDKYKDHSFKACVCALSQKCVRLPFFRLSFGVTCSEVRQLQFLRGDAMNNIKTASASQTPKYHES